MSFFYQLKNHFKNDHLADWYDLQKETYQKDIPSQFYLNLINEKNEYVSKLFDLFNYKYPHYVIKNQNQSQIEHHMHYDNKHIFIDSTLYSKKYNLFVKPDIIIHKDIFQEIFNEVDCSELPRYIIFDVLYVILHYNSDKSDLLNQGNLYYYKCKLSLANSCLYHKPRNGYFLGKEYRHKEKVLPKRQTIGTFPIYSEYFDDIKDGLRWLKRLQNNYLKWNLLPEPSVIELYPNMNCKESNWNQEKNDLASKIKEITLIWNISYEKRCSLIIEDNIKTWDNSFLSSHYELKNHLPSTIKKEMIHINNQTEIDIIPRKIKNREFLSYLHQKNKLILDIESINYYDENQSYFNDTINIDDKPKLCILGTIIEKNKQSIFKDFTINHLDNKEEKKIIIHLMNYLKNIFKEEKIYVYHWGNAEKVYIKYISKRYPEIKLPNIELVDLCYYFKNEPIIIKGCFNYGLKSISKRLYELGYIPHIWPEDMNGLDAMYQIVECSKKADEKNIPLKRLTEIKKIIEYNYYDCLVLYDIIQFLINL